MKKGAKKLPAFRTEEEEREFWRTHSPLDYFHVSRAKKVSFPNLKPSLKTISIRLSVDMLDTLKVLANKRDVPYQSLVKMFLAKQIQQERAPFGANEVSGSKRKRHRRMPKNPLQRTGQSAR
jgi:predicted DNA binding CopG/RHH family protein